mmetsp:Transcript_6812/g.10122  ORF Transcript_6812/g.10122 Transcript_6812/m.10122 type:complete len:205 (+) Transcript_6812:941-1555(+)
MTTLSRTTTCSSSMIFLQSHLPYHHISIQCLGSIARLIAYIIRYLVGMSIDVVVLLVVVVVVVDQWYGCTNDNVGCQINGIVVGYIDRRYTLLLLLVVILVILLVVLLVVVVCICIQIGTQCIGIVLNNVTNLRRIISRGRYQRISITITTITIIISGLNKWRMSRHIPHHIISMLLQDWFPHIHTSSATTIPLDVIVTLISTG